MKGCIMRLLLALLFIVALSACTTTEDHTIKITDIEDLSANSTNIKEDPSTYSSLAPEVQEWIKRSCPDSLPPSLYFECTEREMRAINEIKPLHIIENLLNLPDKEAAWIIRSCRPDYMPPSMFLSCFQREMDALEKIRQNNLTPFR